MHDDREEIDAIRTDIEQTRERIGETAEALGAQLNPTRIKERVGESIREATIGKVQKMANVTKDQVARTGRNFGHVVRENPIPAALVAGGLGWLLFKGRRSTNGDAHVIELTETHVPNMSDDGVMHNEPTLKDNVSNGVRNVGDRVATGARSVATGAKNVASGAKHVAQDVAHKTRHQVDVVGEKLDESPMTIGAIALAVGLAVGFAIPLSAKESRLMGAKRDELLQRAREKVSETTEKVKNVAEEAAPEIRATLQDAARTEGLVR